MRGIQYLHPKLQLIADKFIKECEKQGFNVLITETFRSKQEQDTLYAKGRTSAGNIVTNAKYPLSPHCWGVAFDFCKNIKGHEYDDYSFFKKVGQIGKNMGLTWGGDWSNFPDTPHLELLEFMPNASTKYLQNTYGTPDNFKKTWSDNDMANKYSYNDTVEHMIKDGVLEADNIYSMQQWEKYFAGEESIVRNTDVQGIFDIYSIRLRG